MTAIGHNGGPSMEPGKSWRRHCWNRARRELLPAMPLEVIGHRMRPHVVPRQETSKLSLLENVRRLAAIHLPLDPGEVLRMNAGALDLTRRAPNVFDSWSDTRRRLVAFSQETRIPPDAILVVGDTPVEREWSSTARMAGYLPADRYFGATG